MKSSASMRGLKRILLSARLTLWGRIANEILMMLRAGRKRARDVSLYDTIGTDKDGETVSLMDVLEADEIQALDTIIMEQDVKELYQTYETCLRIQKAGNPYAVRPVRIQRAYPERGGGRSGNFTFLCEPH